MAANGDPTRRLLVFGVNHRSATAALRDRLMLPEIDQPALHHVSPITAHVYQIRPEQYLVDARNRRLVNAGDLEIGQQLLEPITDVRLGVICARRLPRNDREHSAKEPKFQEITHEINLNL